MLKTSEIPENWWENGAGFFGKRYILGDDSFEGYIPGNQESLHERTVREVDGVEQVLDLKQYSSIVDCPCGYGRHSIELANRWYEVIGADINAEHLALARNKLNDLPESIHPKYPGFSKRNIRFIEQDMRTLCNGLYKPVDALINMFYSFGFFATEKENVQTIGQFCLAVKENGGKFLMHTDISPEMLESDHYRLDEVRNLRDGKRLLIKEYFDKETGRMNGSWSIMDQAGREDQLTPYSVRIYSTKELTSIAKYVGFRKISFFGSFRGEEFTSDSRELVMVAER